MNESDYFDFAFSIKSSKPKFKLSLKKKFTKNNIPFFTSSNGKKIPISSSSDKYFKYYFSDENLAINLYNFRKKFFNISYCISFWRENLKMGDEDYSFCENYILISKQKERENYLIATAKDSYAENLKKSREKSSAKISLTMKEKFRDPQYKEKIISLIHSDESKEKRIISFKNTINNPENKTKFLKSVNSPERVAKISESGRKRWKNLSSEEKELQLKNLRYKKNYKLNGFNMNLNEFIVGSILTELCDSWSYENEIRFFEKSYYPDFKIESKKVIIECYGTFWHADPRIFSGDSVVMSNVLASDIWEKDKKRVNNLISLGYKVFIIWEREIHESRDNLRSIIKEAIGE
jgi:hypothetical protein